MSRILRVNMIDSTAKYGKVSDKCRLTGGRWLVSSLVCDQVVPTGHLGV
ncbi:MAG TPA: hypothetical protein VK536_07625 [Candidatus Limnocylindrales bacterium]|nr:hypothetical protein [Candidatus Limnocylindrales bacterium]